VAAARALGVVHVGGAAGDGRHRVLVEAELVDRVGVQVDREIRRVRHPEAAVHHRRGSAEILVDIHPQRAARDGLGYRVGVGVAAPEETEVERALVGGKDDATERVGAGTAHVEVGAGRHADHRRRTARKPVVRLLRRQEMGVGLDRARGDEVMVAMHHGGVGPGHQPRRHAVHDVGVAGLADANDLAAADADVGLHDAGHRGRGSPRSGSPCRARRCRRCRWCRSPRRRA